MSSKECETQLNELLEAWDLDEATLNQTDIEAIKHLLLENQMQQDVIISYKTTNLDQAVDIQQLEQENKQLKEKLSKSEDTLMQILKYTNHRHNDEYVRHIRNIIRGYIEGFDIRELDYKLPFDNEVQEGLDSLNIRGE